MKKKNTGSSLHDQINKLMVHTNQLSIKSQYRYFEATLRFCNFLEDRFNVQKFTNTQTKHVVAYAKHLLACEKAASYIKNELAGIRFFYAQSSGTNKLPDNKTIGEKIGQELPKRSYRTPRAWTPLEYQEGLRLAIILGDDDVYLMCKFARAFGVRLHETVKITRSSLRAAKANGYLHVIGKNGKERDVPVASAGLALINEALEWKSGTEKIFVLEPKQAERAMKRAENWLYRNRSKFSENKITYHGLRYMFAQERYAFYLHKFQGDKQRARRAVSRELGHERDDVTNIYLVGFDDSLY